MKAVVLLSSGLDSTVNLVLAKQEYEKVYALTFDYGQKAASKEILRSTNICNKYEIEHKVIKLDWLSQISNSSLNKGNIPTKNQVDIKSKETSSITAKSVWVPNRNGVLLSIAASYAEAKGAEVIVPGFNKEEAQTFPDNTDDFLQAFNKGLEYSTQFPKVQAKCFTTDLMKSDIVKLGKKMDAPFDMMWPCYFDGDNLCGQCESCQRFNKAMEEA